MNNPTENETPPHPLTPCYSYLAEYLRKIDRNGAQILHDYMHPAKTPADIMRLLTDVLRTRWEVDVMEGERNFDRGCVSRGLEPRDPAFVKALNLEDRENSFAVLERAEHFGSVAYASEFLRLAPYILRNIYSE